MTIGREHFQNAKGSSAESGSRDGSGGGEMKNVTRGHQSRYTALLYRLESRYTALLYRSRYTATALLYVLHQSVTYRPRHLKLSKKWSQKI